MEEQRIILGLTEAEVSERKEKGQINIVEEKNVKSNWEIIAGNVFTLFNLYNFLIAIALMSVGAYSQFSIYFNNYIKYKHWKFSRNTCKEYGS